MKRLISSFICVLVVWVQTTRCQLLYPDQFVSQGSSCRTAAGSSGTCRSSCPQLIPVQSRGTACGSGGGGNNVLICCPKAVYPFIEGVCEHRKSNAEQELQATSDYSHMVVLGWNTASGGTEWTCSGSLIHPSFVLTAATCFDNNRKPDIVRANALSLQEDGSSDLTVEYLAKKILTHPGYRASEFYNDIALLEVEKSPSHSDRATPRSACLFLGREPPTRTLPAMGYATPGYKIRHSYSLLRVNVSLHSQEECENRYKTSPILPFGIIGSQVCATEPGILRDPCEGDSGGAIQYIEDDVPYIFAIVSFATKCLSGDFGVYSRVFNHLDWIERMLNETLT